MRRTRPTRRSGGRPRHDSARTKWRLRTEKNSDGRGVVEVLPLERAGEMWKISCSVDPVVGHLLMQLIPRNGSEPVIRPLLSAHPLQQGRRTYQVSVPIKEIERGRLVALSDTGESIGDVALDLDDPWWRMV
jgi:hypothetical protein